MEQIIKLILELLSVLATVLYLILYRLTNKEVKRLKQQRNFIVHALLTHLQDLAIHNEQYEIADRAKKLLDGMDENMDGIEMTLYNLSKPDKPIPLKPKE